MQNGQHTERNPAREITPNSFRGTFVASRENVDLDMKDLLCFATIYDMKTGLFKITTKTAGRKICKKLPRVSDMLSRFVSFRKRSSATFGDCNILELRPFVCMFLALF